MYRNTLELRVDGTRVDNLFKWFGGSLFFCACNFSITLRIVSQRANGLQPPKSKNKNNDMCPCVLRDMSNLQKGRWDDVVPCSSICCLFPVKPSSQILPSLLADFPRALFLYHFQYHRPCQGLIATQQNQTAASPSCSPAPSHVSFLSSLPHPAPNLLTSSLAADREVFLKPSPVYVVVPLKILKSSPPPLFQMKSHFLSHPNSGCSLSISFF